MQRVSKRKLRDFEEQVNLKGIRVLDENYEQFESMSKDAQNFLLERMLLPFLVLFFHKKNSIKQN